MSHKARRRPLWKKKRGWYLGNGMYIQIFNDGTLFMIPKAIVNELFNDDPNMILEEIK